MGDLPQPPTDEPLTSADYSAELERRIAVLEEKLAFGELTAEAQLRRLLMKEIEQRIWVRWLAIGIALATMCFMGLTVAHVVHKIFIGPFVVVPQTLAIAMFVAPIASITAITIMLSIGAFRKFKDEDMSGVNLASLAAESARSGLTGQ